MTIGNALSKIRDNFFDDQHNWFLWLPFFQISGIVWFIYLRNNDFKVLYFQILTLPIAFLLRKIRPIHITLLPILFMNLGFFAALTKYDTDQQIANTLENTRIKGTITEITRAENGYKLILKNVTLRDFDNIKLSKIKLSVRNLDNPLPGSRLYVKANLMKPADPLFAGMYNFNLVSRFEGIAAVGYAVGKPVIYQRDSSKLGIKIEQIRESLHKYINHNFDYITNAIMVALILGDTKEIKQQDIDNIRNSGLAHVMAVSGLHISLVVAFCFIIIRNVLALIPYFTLNYDLRKPAGLIAILLSLFYVIISGMHASALRAFIMSSLVLIAIILGRNVTYERTISIAAIVILAIAPENILKPGFQMSFAAVSGLVFFYNYYDKKIKILNYKYIHLTKILKYFLGICLSSVIATIFTLPFTLYHFGKLPLYSIISNLLVLPIVSFVIMPFVIVFLIVFPFNSFEFVNFILEKSITYFALVATTFGSIENGSLVLPSLPLYYLVISSICLMGCCYFSGILKQTFALLTITSLFIGITQKKPNEYFISSHNKIYIYQMDSEVNVVSEKISKFQKDIIKVFYGVNNLNIFKECTAIEQQKYQDSCLKFLEQSP